MHWLLHTTSGLFTRLTIGATILATLALVDYRRHGPRATRWREYAFLLAVTLAYGAINDQLTSTISWEYFYYGKGLSEVLGDRIPPDALALHLQAALVGLKATWSAGLLVGVALLLANNPSRRRRPLPQLPYPRLLATLPLILAVTVITACLSAAAGYAGAFTFLSTDFHEMLRRDEFRPRRFMLVFGLHLGGYVGALLGTLAAVVQVRRNRRGALTDSHHKLI